VINPGTGVGAHATVAGREPSVQWERQPVSLRHGWLRYRMKIGRVVETSGKAARARVQRTAVSCSL
jgi:hypothetical protein